MQNSKYVTLVLYRYIGSSDTLKHLAIAPRFTEFKGGDEIVVGGSHASVLASATVADQTEQSDIILKAVGDRLPLPKAEAIVRYEKLKYEEGEENG